MINCKISRRRQKLAPPQQSIKTPSSTFTPLTDYPRQMHVNDVLTDGNYSDWAQEMKNFLVSKNKFGFIDGTIQAPEENSKDEMVWKRCDAMVKGWLITAMEKEIRASVKYSNTAGEIWKDLEERFGKESVVRAYELKQAITTTRQDGSSVLSYYTKLKSIWDEMNSAMPNPKCTCTGCTCGVGKKLFEAKDKERMYEFLMGLDSSFGTLRTQILAMKPTSTLGAAYDMLAEDERQRAITGGKKPVKEAAVVSEKAQHCTHCGKDGHSYKECFQQSPVMAGLAPEVSHFDAKQYDARMNDLSSTEGQEFFISYDEVDDSFDAMGLQENLLRGIYAYGFEKPSAIQQRGIVPWALM